MLIYGHLLCCAVPFLPDHCVGESAWLGVIERYEENKRIEEYKASHGGRAPPDPVWKAVLKTFAPCFFREKVHIVMGYVCLT